MRDHVAAPEFFNETLSLLVDQNGAVKPGVGDQLNRARDRVADRVGLDVLHVDEFRPGAFRHVERFARRGRGVRGLKAFIERRVVLLHHRGIVTEAAKAVAAKLNQDGLPYLTATHDQNNPRSGGVMQNIGMRYCYSYQEQWQPKDILVPFRLYQLNLDGREERVYRKYWDNSAVHFVEKL